MSLKAFHIVFITLSSLLAFAFGVWCLRYSSLRGDGSFVGLGIGSFVIGAGLILYGIWFYRKIRTPEEERRRRRNLFRSVSALGAVWLLSTRMASACSVCYGEAEGPMLDAARMAVWLMFGLVLALQVSFASFFICLWRRARKHRQEESTPPTGREGVA